MVSALASTAIVPTRRTAKMRRLERIEDVLIGMALFVRWRSKRASVSI